MNNISVGELKNLVGKANIIDVREIGEYAGGHVPTAINIPLSTLGSNVEKFNKEEMYYIICQSGGRSMMACNQLAAAGIKVTNVAGGTGAYAMNFDLES